MPSVGVPASYSMAAGVLPEGLLLSDTGRIEGSPTDLTATLWNADITAAGPLGTATAHVWGWIVHRPVNPPFPATVSSPNPARSEVIVGGSEYLAGNPVKSYYWSIAPNGDVSPALMFASLPVGFVSYSSSFSTSAVSLVAGRNIGIPSPQPPDPPWPVDCQMGIVDLTRGPRPPDTPSSPTVAVVPDVPLPPNPSGSSTCGVRLSRDGRTALLYSHDRLLFIRTADGAVLRDATIPARGAGYVVIAPDGSAAAFIPRREFPVYQQRGCCRGQ